MRMVPATTATEGVPRALSMSTPWWRRPPLRGRAHVSTNVEGPATGHSSPDAT